MKNRLLLMLLLAALTVCAVPVMAETGAADETASGTEVKEGWDGSCYYVNGTMLTSVLKKIDGAYYYFGTDGEAVVNTLKTIKKKKYYFGDRKSVV